MLSSPCSGPAGPRTFRRIDCASRHLLSQPTKGAGRPPFQRRRLLLTQALRPPKVSLAPTAAAEVSVNKERQLAQELLQTEVWLRSLFAPGSLPPKASTVVEARQRVASIKQALVGAVRERLGPHSSQAEARAASALAVGHAAAQQAQAAIQEVNRCMDKQPVAVVVNDMPAQQQQEARALQADLAKLRGKADALRARHQQLQECFKRYLQTPRFR